MMACDEAPPGMTEGVCGRGSWLVHLLIIPSCITAMGSGDSGVGDDNG